MVTLRAQPAGRGGGGRPPRKGSGGKRPPNGGGSAPWLPVPESTKTLLDAVAKKRLVVHPALAVTKFVKWNRSKKELRADRDGAFGAIVEHLGSPSARDLAKAWRRRRLRWLKPLLESDRARVLEVQAVSPCVLWLAAPSPLELGFCLHHTYGLPYLPGSGLKGLARAGMTRALGGSVEEPPREVLQLFGEGGDEGHAGLVDFLDGIPIEADCLEPEVMSPHHPSYYQGKEEVPHDGEDPVPLYFLRIKPASRFEIALVGRRGASRRDLEKAEECLLQSLREMGLGGKTSSGYGLFGPPQPSPPSGPGKGAPQPPAASGSGKRTLVVQVERFDPKRRTVTFKVVQGGQGPLEANMDELQNRFGFSRLKWNDHRKSGQQFIVVMSRERIEDFRKK